MAAGDIVNGIFTTVATTHYFQPAASVEVCITSTLGAKDNELRVGISNGVNNGLSALMANGRPWIVNTANTKIMINNTNYLSLYFSSDQGSYSGIQIK